MVIKDLTDHLHLSPNEKSKSNDPIIGYWHYDAINDLFEYSGNIKDILEKKCIGKKLQDLIHVDDQTIFHALWLHAMTNLEPFFVKCRMIINDKTHFVSIKSRIDLDHLKLQGFYGTIEDISQKIVSDLEDTPLISKLTNKVLDLQKDMNEIIEINEKNSQIKSNFLSTMSHEIRTPMNAMLGFTKLLEETNLSTEQQEYVMRIDDASTHLLSIVNDILDLSKMEAGKMTLEFNHFRLDKLVNDVKDLLEKSADRKHLYFDVETMNCPTMLIGDPMRIKQILINLISNAIKFTEVGGVSLVISCDAIDENHVRIHFKISDTGIGMTENQQQKLFADFEQTDLSISRKYGGTGLGLSISKKLSDLMHGKITATSKLNEGTTFIFSVPLEMDEDDDDEVSDTKPLIFKDHMSILVAEDHVLSQKLTERLLLQLNVKVVIVDNGEKAIKAMKDDHFDLVFLDMNMPIMDGIEAAKAIRRFNTKTPLIALTANQYPEERSACLLAGMNDIIIKPIDRLMLTKILAKWLPED